MKFTLIDHAKESERVVETPLTLKQWMSVNLGAWGFYRIKQIDKKHYEVTDTFDGSLVYTIKGGR